MHSFNSNVMRELIVCLFRVAMLEVRGTQYHLVNSTRWKMVQWVILRQKFMMMMNFIGIVSPSSLIPVQSRIITPMEHLLVEFHMFVRWTWRWVGDKRLMYWGFDYLKLVSVWVNVFPICGILWFTAVMYCGLCYKVIEVHVVFSIKVFLKCHYYYSKVYFYCSFISVSPC